MTRMIPRLSQASPDQGDGDERSLLSYDERLCLRTASTRLQNRVPSGSKANT